MLAIRGNVEDTGNGAARRPGARAGRADGAGTGPLHAVPPGPRRRCSTTCSVTRNLLAHYRGSEIHNELLHDESVAFAVDRKYPESDHAPVVATFEFV